MPFVKRKNDHQTHFEDLVLIGPDGLEELDDKIEGMIDKLEDREKTKNRLNITVKIDGAPAVFCWSSYPGLPDNSISLKTFTKDTAADNCISSVEQIDKKYTPVDSDGNYLEDQDDRKEFRQTLKYCLQLAHYIPAGECWQGDCLFTRDTKKEENINGTDYITFQPNKIIYAFSEKNPGYEEVKNADFGIAFHTIYRGENKQQSFNVDRSRLKGIPSNIYIMSPALPIDVKSFNLNRIKAHVNKLHSLESALLSFNDYKVFVSNEEFMKDFWNTFENNTIADNKQVTINETTFINELKDHIKDKLTKKANKLKTEKGRAGYMTRIDELAEVVNSNENLLKAMVRTLNEAARIKMLLWEGLKQPDLGYDTYYKSRTKGYFKGDMEGIRMSDQDGNIVKIVDRTNFSSYNRDPDIVGGWERESLGEDYQSMLNSGEDIMTVAFGRMSVPTIGHLKLVKFMASQSKGVKARLYLSHKTGQVSDPLPYEDKLYWCKKAFEPLIDVVESPLNSPLMILSDIYRKDGYTGNVLYVCGEDRLEEAKKWKKYNGQPDGKGKLLFDFADYDAISAGNRNKNSSDLLETVSGTMVRQCVLDGDFDLFKKLVPFNENDAEDLYEELEESFKALGALGESLTEASILSKKKYVSDPEVKDNLEKELDEIDPRLEAPNPNMDIDSYRLNQNKDYQGLFVKQGTRDNVSFSKPDVANYAETTLNSNGEKVVKELSDMTFKDSQGKDYRLYPSGSRMGKGASFTAKDSTYYQEALQMLLLTNKLKYIGSDLANYLLGSDPEGNIGVFDQIIVKPYKDISIFRQCWTQFVQTWKKAFDIDVKESDKFVSEVSRVFGGSNNLIPLHDGINSKYSQLSGSVLTQQKDFIDKSDGYVFNGEYLSEMNKIFSTMASLLKEKKAVEYVKYVQQNSNKVVGVSLKKNNGSELVVDGYDIQRNSDIFTGRLALLGTGSGRSWSIRFETDDKPIGLDIRPAGDAANKIEFRVPGSPANGNAIKALQYVFGDNYETFGRYIKGKDFESAAKWLCGKFVGLDSIEPNTTYEMTNQGLNLVKRIFNLASGFEASDDKGNKITAPYIKVH